LPACCLCKTIKDLDWAAETLKRAILYGGFRYVEALRQALTRQEGALYAIRERVQNFPSQYKANDYTGHDRDVHEYLKGLVGEVFGEKVNKK